MTETLKTVLRQFTSNRKYTITAKTHDVYITHASSPCRLLSAHTEDEMKHYLRAMALAKNAVGRLSEDTVWEMAHLVSMAKSVITYGSHNVEDVLKNKYIIDYKLPLEAKRIMVSYITKAIGSTGYGGEDGEGNSYRSCQFVPFPVTSL